MYVVIESITFTMFLCSGTKNKTFTVFLRSGTKKHYVYCVFALGDEKSIAFIVCLRSGTTNHHNGHKVVFWNGPAHRGLTL